VWTHITAQIGVTTVTTPFSTPIPRPAVAALAALGLAALTGLAAPSFAAQPPAVDASGSAVSSLTGSIVYIKANNVWLARPDGSGAVPVTTDGTADVPYRAPSESDTGVIVAAKGGDVIRMAQNGQVLGSFEPPTLPSTTGTALSGPFVNDLAISPDGTKIAYTRYMYQCPAGVSCGVRYGSAVTDAGGTLSPATYGSDFFRTPSWVGNGRLLESAGFGHQMILRDLGGAGQTWFNDTDVFQGGTDLADGELSPDGQWLAAVRGYGSSSHIIWYAVQGNAAAGAVPPPPAFRCNTSEEAGLNDPTWSPDSRALAWESAEGIWMLPDAAACENSPAPALVAPGGKEPDWSAAPVNPAPRVIGSARPTVSGKAVVGKRLRAVVGSWTPAPTTYAFRWLRNGKPIKKATQSTYRLTRKDRGKKISVEVTGTASGYVSQTAVSAAVKVKSKHSGH
jgi:hypothetical protein